MQNHEPAQGTMLAGGDAAAQPETQHGREGGIQFLPVNQVVSSAEATRQRAYLSCDACRQRKTRCVPASPGQRHPCRRCVADDRSCEFRNSRGIGTRRTTRGRLSARGSTRASQRSAGQEPVTILHDDMSGSSRSGEPAAGFGGRADDATMLEDPGPQPGPGYRPPFASPGESSVMDGFQAMCDMDAGGQSASTGSPYTAKVAAQSTARSRIITTRLHDTADALDLLTLAAAGVQNEAEDSGAQRDGNPSHPYAASMPSAHLNVATGETWPRPADETDWGRFILIKKGVVTKLEVVEYLDFYFGVLWPLRPIVHAFYRDSARYVLLAVEEPLLLTCLVTLASRYHILSGAHGEIRSERIHWQAWRLLQKYLQSALWGSLVTRSLGAIAAMLLMIEWHSKSINNPLGLSDGDDYDLFSIPASGQRYDDENGRNTISSSAGRQRFGMSTLLEKLNIVAPAYRSNKMSWMLLSNAIALAQESGCFEQVPRESQGTFSAGEAFKHEWNQLICVFIYLADESLSLRLGLETLSPSKSTDAVRARLSSSFASLLPDSVLWESYYELTLEAKKARELLQSLKRAGPTVAAGSILPDLEHIERGLGRWKRHYSYAVADDASLLRACVDLEYQYLVMYSFAPASYMAFNDADCGESSERPARSRRSEALLALADRATSAGREMLNTLINILEPSNMLKYVPVRCWQFVVAANLHLLKTTLTDEVVTAESRDDVRLLRASIVAIRNGSPDDTHMAIRYARFLEIMLDASHHASQTETPAPVGSGFGPADGGAHGSAAGFMTSLNDFEVPDIVSGLGNIGDLIDLSDGSFGILGAMGFLPNR